MLLPPAALLFLLAPVAMATPPSNVDPNPFASHYKFENHGKSQRNVLADLTSVINLIIYGSEDVLAKRVEDVQWLKEWSLFLSPLYLIHQGYRKTQMPVNEVTAISDCFSRSATFTLKRTSSIPDNTKPNTSSLKDYSKAMECLHLLKSTSAPLTVEETLKGQSLVLSFQTWERNPVECGSNEAIRAFLPRILHTLSVALVVLSRYEDAYHFTRSYTQPPSPLIRDHVVRHLRCLKDAAFYAIDFTDSFHDGPHPNWKFVIASIHSLIMETDVMDPTHFSLHQVNRAHKTVFAHASTARAFYRTVLQDALGEAKMKKWGRWFDFAYVGSGHSEI